MAICTQYYPKDPSGPSDTTSPLDVCWVLEFHKHSLLCTRFRALRFMEEMTVCLFLMLKKPSPSSGILPGAPSDPTISGVPSAPILMHSWRPSNAESKRGATSLRALEFQSPVHKRVYRSPVVSPSYCWSLTYCTSELLVLSNSSRW